jgi:hypothetical protein
MEYSLDRPRSPRHRRSRSPPPRGTVGGSRREREERRRYEDSSLRDDRGHRRTESDESYKHGTREDRKQDSRPSLSKRDDGSLKKTRFDDTRKPIGETIKSPLEASSTKQASIIQSSNSRRDNSPMRTPEQTDSQKASYTSQAVSSLPVASETSHEVISAKPDVIPNTALQQIPLPRSIIANIDAELETRPISVEESKWINGIWDHRVGLVYSPLNSKRHTAINTEPISQDSRETPGSAAEEGRTFLIP